MGRHKKQQSDSDYRQICYRDAIKRGAPHEVAMRYADQSERRRKTPCWPSLGNNPPSAVLDQYFRTVKQKTLNL
jgi:hypothetical protein